MTPDLQQALEDVIFWSERVADHLHGVEEADFLQSELLCDAICWCISCIGEAAARIRRDWPEFITDNSDLELPKSIAMRNRIVHGYFALDNRIIWKAATESVPALLAAVRDRVS